MCKERRRRNEEEEMKKKKKKMWRSQVATEKVRSVCLGVVRLGLGLGVCLCF